VVKSEFTVFSLLGFSMHVRVAEVMPGFHRCLHRSRHAHGVFGVGNRGIEQHGIAAKLHRQSCI
jgi:hypothetical protein